MAIKLDFTDARTGLSVTDAHWKTEVADFKNFNQIIIRILVQQSEANKSKRPLRRYFHVVDNTDTHWDTYFALTAMNPVGKNIFKNIDTYLNTELDGTQEGDTAGIDFTAGTIV